MAMKKMGESQIIKFFGEVISGELHKKYGQQISYVQGDFSGSQDRKFADYFVGTESANMLIEFKERKTEYKDEFGKPLRKKLCKTLNQEIAGLSRACHFIGWGTEKRNMQVELNPYIDLVCTLWESIDHLIQPQTQLHDLFIEGFLDGRVGVSYDEFVGYIHHLNKTAGGTAAGDQVPFRSILFSRDNTGKIIGTRFESLGELLELRNIKPPTTPIFKL